MLCRNMLSMIDWYFWDQFQMLREFLYSVFNRLPQLAISVAIIALGIWLIGGKRKELKHEVKEIKALAQEIQIAEPAVQQPEPEIQKTEEPEAHEA